MAGIRLALRAGCGQVDRFLDSLTCEQFRELVAYELAEQLIKTDQVEHTNRLEPTDFMRLHGI